MQNAKIPIPKHSGNPGHKEKFKSKDNKYKREQKFPSSKTSNIFNKIIGKNFPKL